MITLKKIVKAAAGVAIGFVNGLFGAGGGMIAVPLLKKAGYNQKEAQSNAISIIFPLTLVSFLIYLSRGAIDIIPSLKYIPGGIAGAMIGTLLMKKIKPQLLRLIFSAFILWAGIRMVAG